MTFCDTQIAFKTCGCNVIIDCSRLYIKKVKGNKSKICLHIYFKMKIYVVTPQ